METLVDRMKQVLINSNELIAPTFDIHFDEKNNVVGYIASKTFSKADDKRSQKLIWRILQNHFGQDELNKISAIFTESPQEKIVRLTKQQLESVSVSKFWLHKTPDLTKYWLFIDSQAFGENYKSFFLIINQRESFKKTVIFNYDKEIIEFMELTDEHEINNELYSHAFAQAESEIKLNIMQKYDSLTEKGLWGKNNRFSYVFEHFEIKPCKKKDVRLNNEEISFLKNELIRINDFSLKREIEGIIKNLKNIKIENA